MPDAPKTRKCHRCNGTKKFHGKPCAMCKGAGQVTARPVFTTATHLAERPVNINGRTIQRCCVCGFKLIDDHGRGGTVDARGKAGPVMTFEPGDFVRLPLDVSQTDNDEPRRPILAGHTNTDRLPADFCIDMVE